MTQNEAPSGLAAQQVFDFLRGHPGAVFLLEDICGQTGYTPAQARLALETLMRHGLIDQERTVGGQDAYVYRLRDPLRPGYH